tara:strand:- start:16 stop:684 length:669 start_codon:yes stop_codon:yes gene_type:complete
VDRVQEWLVQNQLGAGIGIGVLLMSLVAWTAVSSGNPKRMAVADVIVLNEDESWFGKSELYLKVSSSLHSDGRSILFPLNVGHLSGKRQVSHALPFAFREGVSESWIFEVLDEDDLSTEQEQAIYRATKTGVGLLWIGGKMYAMSEGVTLPDEGEELVSDLAQLTTGLILENMKQHIFDSYGTATFLVPDHIPTSRRDSNPVVVYDDDNVAIIEIRIYSPGD